MNKKIFLLASFLLFQSFACLAIVSWELPAIDLSENTQNATIPQVAIDDSGNAIAVWSRSNGTNTIIQTKRYDATTNSWPINALDLSESGENATNPQIAMDPDGNATAVWQRYDGANWIIQATRYDITTGSWSLFPANLSTGGVNGDGTIPQVAMDQAGNATVVWKQDDVFGGSTIQASRYDATTQTWSAATNLFPLVLGDDGLTPQVAMDASGNAIAIWIKTSGVSKVIQVSRYSSGSWSGATTLASSIFSVNDPQIAMDPTGNATAVWIRNTGVNNIVETKRYDVSSGIWSATATGLSQSGQNAALPQVAMDSTGNAIATWQRSDGSNTIIQTKRYDGSWPDEAIDLSESGQNATKSQIAMDSSGNGIATWTRSNGTNTIIQAKRYDVSSDMWSSNATNLSEDGKNADDSQVSMNSLGNGIAVWARADNQTDNTVIQTIFFSTQLSAPTNLTATKKCLRFPTQTDIVHCLTWDAVESATKYRIYVDASASQQIIDVADDANVASKFDINLGVKIAETTNPCVEIRKRCSGAQATYYVVGVDENGDNGQAASVII